MWKNSSKLRHLHNTFLTTKKN